MAVGLGGGHAVRLQVRAPLGEHARPRGTVRVDAGVGDQQQAAGRERLVDPRVQRALGVEVVDVVQRQRGDDGVARRQRVVERGVAELDPITVMREARARDVEHRGVDVDQADPRRGDAREDGAGERAGARAQVDHQAAVGKVTGQPADDRGDRRLVTGHERSDRGVVLAGADAEVGVDAVGAAAHADDVSSLRRGVEVSAVVILRAMSSPRALLAPAFLACSLVACGGGGGDSIDADPGAPDAAAVIDADPTAPDAAGPDAATGCGTATPPLASLGGTEGIAIAPDGTIYYSQSGGRVGRWQPGDADGDDSWVTLAGATTVWGMGLGETGILYVATPGSGGNIWEIDTSAATPTGTALYPAAGSANGLTIGPDGAIYYGNFAASGHVYRVSTAGGVRTQVTATTIAQPNGVLFDADGTLLVASYQSGIIHRLTLDGEMQETARVTALTGTGNPDGLARDAQGRIYVTNNSGGTVLRFTPGTPTPAPETVLTGVAAAANMAFGRGALACEDLYVTSSGALRRLDAGAPGVP